MKFDFVIGNPPYQEETTGTSNQAKPVYHKFVEEAIKLDPECVVMITPSRWFAGGMGLDDFRNKMLASQNISRIVDYTNAKDCFSGISISGGVNYFAWKPEQTSNCVFTNITNNKEDTTERPLNEFPVLVRYNKAVDIIHKVKELNEPTVDSLVSAISPYALSTKIRGTASKTKIDDVLMHSSQGVSYIPVADVTKGLNTIDTYRVLVSQTSAEHAGEPSKDGTFRVLTKTLKVMNPGEVCTHSYIFIGPLDSKESADNVVIYLRTKFARFLILQTLMSIHISRASFVFLPLQKFNANTDINWSKSVEEVNRQLYKKYGLSDEEIEFIESHVKEME